MKLPARRNNNNYPLSFQISKEITAGAPSLVSRKPNLTSSQQTIEEIYGNRNAAGQSVSNIKMNRFRTLRRDKEYTHEPGSQELLDSLNPLRMNTSKIENSFNNIIINFTDAEHPRLPSSTISQYQESIGQQHPNYYNRESFNNTIHPSSQNTKMLIAQRRSRESATSSHHGSLGRSSNNNINKNSSLKKSTQLQSTKKTPMYSFSGSHSRSRLQRSSYDDSNNHTSSVMIKDKTTSLDKARISMKTSQHSRSKGKRTVEKSVTLDRYDRLGARNDQAVQLRINKKNKEHNNEEEELMNVVNSFVSNFQRVLNEPINLQTFETKEMRLTRKCREAAAQGLVRVLKRKISQKLSTFFGGRHHHNY